MTEENYISLVENREKLLNELYPDFQDNDTLKNIVLSINNENIGNGELMFYKQWKIK